MSTKINIFPFSTRIFSDEPYDKSFNKYFRETLPDVNILRHNGVRTPGVIVFAYEGDHTLWGYAEIEKWQNPTEDEVKIRIEEVSVHYRRVYVLKPRSLREFVRHVSYDVLRLLGYDARSITYCPELSEDCFSHVLKEGEGEQC